jgi:hypothetical protein
VTAVAQRHEPLYRTAPVWAETDGDVAHELAADLGWDLDEVQRWHVDAMLAVDGAGLPACRDVCIVGPRQTVGKTVAMKVAALFDVFVAEVPLHVWTAHLYSTSQKAYEDMRDRILRHRDYASRCTFRETNGEQQIQVDGRYTIEFHARSGKTGRGFTTGRLTLDEWMFGRPGDLGALSPTMVTMPDAQVRYASSAGLVTSGALRELRERGRPGGDPSLAYVELGAPVTACGAGAACRHDLDDPGCALNDRDLWWQANSGLWSGRVREADVATQRRRLDPAEFAREFLSWWEDPPGGGGGAVDLERWQALAAGDVERGRRVVFAVAVAPDRSWAAVAVAWRRPDGRVHVTSIDYRPHASWVADRVSELRRRWGGSIVVDSRARDLLPASTPRLSQPGESQQALAEAALSDAVTAGTLTHDGAPELVTSVRGAAWRQAGAHRRLEPAGSADISPLRAAALAVHAALNAPNPLDSIL